MVWDASRLYMSCIEGKKQMACIMYLRVSVHTHYDMNHALIPLLTAVVTLLPFLSDCLHWSHWQQATALFNHRQMATTKRPAWHLLLKHWHSCCPIYMNCLLICQHGHRWVWTTSKVRGQVPRWGTLQITLLPCKRAKWPSVICEANEGGNVDQISRRCQGKN